MSNQSLIEVAKDLPVAGLVGLTLFGIGLSEWLVILGVAYGVWRLVASIIEFYWKVQDRKAAKEAEDARED